jgi:hypothetical protein
LHVFAVRTAVNKRQVGRQKRQLVEGEAEKSEGLRPKPSPSFWGPLMEKQALNRGGQTAELLIILELPIHQGLT